MRLWKLALVLGAVAVLSAPALAQRGRGFGGGFGRGPDQLVRVEKVQKDLGLDKDAVTKVTEALTKVREDMRDEYGKLGFNSGASPEEQAEARKKIREAQNKALASVLNEKQMKRLHQIELQQQQQFGLALYQNDEVKKALKLTPEQTEKIKTISDDLGKEIREMFQGGGKPDPETMKKVQGLNKEAQTNAAKVLTDDQKKTLKEMMGEPLELKPEDFPARGRGGKPNKPRTDF